MTTTMRAIVRDRYGVEHVHLREVAVPVPKGDEVRIRVRASSVNPADWFFTTGTPWPLRLQTGLFRPKEPVLGIDVAGEVEAVGPGVTRFRAGDAVFGEVSRAYADYVCASEARLAHKPAALSFEQAASLPVAGITALQAMRDSASVQPRQHVLVNGASGGVGTFTVQVAKALGAEVTAVCSARNAELVRAIGADHVVDYAERDFTQTSARYDAILDVIGSAPISRCRAILRPSGVYVSSVGRLRWLFASLVASFTPGPRVKILSAQSTPEDLSALAELVASGAVKPVIDRVCSLEEGPEALRRQGEGHARGKSVIRVHG